VKIQVECAPHTTHTKPRELSWREH